MKPFTRLALFASLALLTDLAQAQYIWIDAKGIKQLSDVPPPPSIPAKNILKQPRGLPAPADTAPKAEPAAAAAAASSNTLADREADYKTRQLEKADKDKTALEETKQKAAEKHNCDLARSYKKELASGQRIGVIGKNGEQGFMGDAERAQKTAEANRVLNGCK